MTAAPRRQQQKPRFRFQQHQQQQDPEQLRQQPEPQQQRQFQSSWDAKEASGGRNAEADYLYELGASQQYNINVDHGRACALPASLMLLCEFHSEAALGRALSCLRSLWARIHADEQLGPLANAVSPTAPPPCSAGHPAGQNAANLDSLFVGSVLGHKSDIADGSLRAYEMRKLDNLVGDYYIAPRWVGWGWGGVGLACFNSGRGAILRVISPRREAGDAGVLGRGGSRRAGRPSVQDFLCTLSAAHGGSPDNAQGSHLNCRDFGA